MQKNTLDVSDFFKESEAIKNQRGISYDNGGRSAYQIGLDMVSSKNRYLISIAPIIQKTSRLITLAQEAQEGNFDAEAWDDTTKDLANYAGMSWLEIAKPALKSVDDIKNKNIKYATEQEEVIAADKDAVND